MVTIIMEGGHIREILSDVPGEAVVIDLSGGENGEGRVVPTSLPEGERVIAHAEGLAMTVNPIFISALKSRLTSAKD